MLWEVRSARLRVPWRLAAAHVLEHDELPDGRFRWVVDSPEAPRVLLRLLPGVLSVEPLGQFAKEAGEAAA